MPRTITCDICGTTISPRDLRAKKAVELKGAHYCEMCKELGAPADGSPGEESGKKGPLWQKKFLIISGASAGASILGLVITFFLTGTPPEPTRAPTPSRPTREAPVVRETPRVDVVALRGRLDESGTDPEKLTNLIDDLNDLEVPVGLETSYNAFLKDLKQRTEESAELELERVLVQTGNDREREMFKAAHDRWKKMPRIIWGSRKKSKWIEEEVKAKNKALVWTRYLRLVDQARKYYEANLDEVAVAILKREENLPANCERLHPEIWAKRETLIKNFYVDRGALVAEAARAAVIAIEEIKEQQFQRRKNQHENSIGEVDPEPLISREGNLENWAHRQILGTIADARHPWTIQEQEGQPVLQADNSDRPERVEIGMNGERWFDWALEFDVKVEKGTLHLQTRTNLEGGVFRTSVVSRAPQEFDFSADRYGQWKRIRVVAFWKWITCSEYDGDTTNQKERTETSERQTGGFVFSLEGGGVAKIRDARLQILFHDDLPRDL